VKIVWRPGCEVTLTMTSGMILSSRAPALSVGAGDAVLGAVAGAVCAAGAAGVASAAARSARS
jgi:hypothetical protein